MIVATARKLPAAMLLPLVAAVAGLGVALGHDFDATFFGVAGGLIFAIPLAGSGRQKRGH